MSGLCAPGLGPIVDHTTETSCRIWIRAGNPGDEGAALDSERRTLGVIAVVAENGKDVPESRIDVHYFRLRREFDRTGTLTPD
jgi:alkaline phosphatase D